MYTTLSFVNLAGIFACIYQLYVSDTVCMCVLVSGDPGKMPIHCSIVDVIVDADHFSMNNHDKRKRREGEWKSRLERERERVIWNLLLGAFCKFIPINIGSRCEFPAKSHR